MTSVWAIAAAASAAPENFPDAGFDAQPDDGFVLGFPEIGERRPRQGGGDLRRELHFRHQQQGNAFQPFSAHS
jgi:hypothetical protein